MSTQIGTSSRFPSDWAGVYALFAAELDQLIEDIVDEGEYEDVHQERWLAIHRDHTSRKERLAQEAAQLAYDRARRA